MLDRVFDLWNLPYVYCLLVFIDFKTPGALIGPSISTVSKMTYPIQAITKILSALYP